MKPIYMLLALCTLLSPALTHADEKIMISPGIWQQKIRMLVARADIFTALHRDGTCFQIAQGRAFGKTQWAYMECSWIQSANEFTLTITNNLDSPDLNGHVTNYQILSANPDQVSLQDRDEELEWSLVEHLPEEFEEKLQEYLNDEARQGPNGS